MQCYDAGYEFCVMRLCHVESYTVADHFFMNYTELYRDVSFIGLYNL